MTGENVVNNEKKPEIKACVRGDVKLHFVSSISREKFAEVIKKIREACKDFSYQLHFDVNDEQIQD